MKTVKIILCVILLLGLAGGWYGYFSDRGEQSKEYQQYMEAGESSLQAGLYEQAIEDFKLALGVQENVEAWRRISKTYEEYLSGAEAPATAGRSFIKDMQAAVAAYPTEAEFYHAALSWQMSNKDYRSAKRLTDQAIKAGVSDETIEEAAFRLEYMTSVHYKHWNDITQASLAYYVARDNNGAVIIDADGEACSDSFGFVGPVSESGYTVVQKPTGFRLIDIRLVERGILPDNTTDAGVYDETTGLIPLCIDGMWQYYSVQDGLLSERYDEAGAYVNETAAVLKEGQWLLIEPDGAVKTQLPFDDIKLGIGGEYVRGGRIAAQSNGVWKLYSEKLEPVGDLSADEMDLITGEYTAFKSGGRWGYADTSGKVVLEPTYDWAKSFSNGLAAVCLDGLWGFIDKEFRVVISPQFQEAGYFNNEGSCYVRVDGDTWQRLYFVLD